MKTVRSFQLVHDESETDLLAKLTFVFAVIFLSVRIIAEWLYKDTIITTTANYATLVIMLPMLINAGRSLVKYMKGE